MTVLVVPRKGIGAKTPSAPMRSEEVGEALEQGQQEPLSLKREGGVKSLGSNGGYLRKKHPSKVPGGLYPRVEITSGP